MNIEDLAKDTKDPKEPAKKKGYDDVEFSDLSGEDDDNKKSKRKDVKKTKRSEVKGRNVDKKEKKENDKKQEKTQQQRTTKAEEAQQKTPVSKTVEDKTHEDRPANVVTIPKYTAPPLPAGAEPQKKGCCALM